MYFHIFTQRVAEQRRLRVKELEIQLSQYKKKLVEQSKIVKMKETQDKQMQQLNNEIQVLEPQ